MIASLFSFNSTPTTEIYTLSLHDALPIYTLQTKLPKEDSEQLLQMTEILQKMLEQVREGFSERELDPASQVLRADHEVDQVHRSLFRRHLQATDDLKLPHSIDVLLMAQAPDRPGHHATN